MSKTLYEPMGGNEMPRFAGPTTMMRLPMKDSAEGLDACFVGVPFDIGTSNRSGARFGPRQIRCESVLLRPYNMGTRAAPFDALAVADIGDVATNPYNLLDSVARIEGRLQKRWYQAFRRPSTIFGHAFSGLPSALVMSSSA